MRLWARLSWGFIPKIKVLKGGCLSRISIFPCQLIWIFPFDPLMSLVLNLFQFPHPNYTWLLGLQIRNVDSSLKGFLSLLSKLSPFEPTFISAICIWRPSGCMVSWSWVAPHRGNQSKPGIGILLSVTGQAILDLVLRVTFGVTPFVDSYFPISWGRSRTNN